MGRVFDKYVMDNDPRQNTMSSDFWEKDEFDALKSQLETYIAHKKEKDLKIWVPKCKTGEEAYIIGIALQEVLDKDIDKYQILIFATDDNKNELIQAKEGVFDPKVFKGLGQYLLDKYFKKRGDHFAISHTVKAHIFFSIFDFTQKTMIEKFDLISCRNLSSFFDHKRISELVSIFNKALHAHGILYSGIPVRQLYPVNNIVNENWDNTSRKLSVANHINSNHNDFCFDKIIKHTGSLLCITDANGKLKYVSPATEKLLGNTKCELIGKNFSSFVHDHDQIKITRHLCNVKKSQKKKLGLRLRLSNGNNSYKWIEGEITNLLHLPEVNGLIITFRKIDHWKNIQSELKREQNLLRTIIDHIPDSIFAIDTDSRYILGNNAVLNSLEIESEEKLIGKTAIDIFGPSAQPLMENSKRILDGGEPTINKEHPIFIKEKQKTRWVKSSIIPFKNQQGTIEGLVGISRDITEKKEDEERLQQSHEQLNLAVNRLMTILNTLPAHIALLDKDSNVIEANQSWKKFTREHGFQQKYYGVGSNHIKMLEYRNSRNGQDVATNLRKILSGDIDQFTQEYPLEYSNQKIWFRIHSAAINDEQSNKGAVIMYIDITPIKLAEAKMQESNERFKLANMATNEAIWEWEFKSDMLYWGDGFKRLFGYKIDSEGQPVDSWEKNIHPDDHERVVKGLNAAISNPLTNMWEDEYRFFNVNNEIVYVYDRGYIIYNSHNKPVKMVGSMSDITDKKKEEKEKQRMMEDLIQRNKDLEQFAYITSHNLRAPVSNIIAISRLLKDENRAKENKQVFINSIHDSVTRLDDVINDLNEILKVKHEVSENKTIVLFDDLVEEVSNGMSKLMKEQGVTIESDFAEINEMLTLKSYIFSIFHHLISNGIKYRQPDKSPFITIKSHHPSEDKILITLEDNGLGINLDKKKDQVFGLYKRFHRHIKGKGMGLFMVKNQVEALGGKISVKSEVNVGTQFTLEFIV